MDHSTSPDVDVSATDDRKSDARPSLQDTPDTAEQTSPINDDDADQPQRLITGPMQKRRRVTRACDECRRKKIKCDGKQPCTHCTVYSYECTYDQPSNRRRTAAPQYIEALETQLKRAKGILSLIIPTLDLNDASIDAHLQSGILPQLPSGMSRQPQDPHVALCPSRDDAPRPEAADSHLESMVKATGQLDLDEDGNWDYYGHSSGLSFMRRIQQDFGHIIGEKQPDHGLFAKYRAYSSMVDSPSSSHLSPGDSGASPATELPPKEEARRLCDHALIDAGALLRVVHLPTFYKSFDRMYETSPDNYTNTEHSFLPLLYAVLALGTLFSERDAEDNRASYEAIIEEGYKYFRSSRQLLDITDCRDLVSLQAIVFMIQFLQSSAKLSTCYSYIGVALRSALRMGLHRSFNIDFSPIEAETRKRLFWVIWRMDAYVGAMLGLPHLLEDADVDQDYPTEVDDEYITETEIKPMPEGSISVMAASNAHAKIIQVLAKVCKYVYPTKGTHSGGKYSMTYSVSYSKIREIEQDMQNWLDELPMALKPGGESSPIMMRIQQLLRMGFAHAQLLLYRPFLHYVSQPQRTKASVDQRAFACASACVSVSRNIIHIIAEMKRCDLLIGAYWFSMYTTFFAVMTLLYFVLENPNSATSYELFRDATEGKKLLDEFAKRSVAADRCSATLKAIFDKLPESFTKGPTEVEESKKRRKGSSPQSLQSRPQLLKDEFVATGVRRAQTFPESMSNAKRTALPLSQKHLVNLGVEPSFSPSSPSDYFEPPPSLTPTSASVSTSSLSSYGLPAGTDRRVTHPFSATPLPGAYHGPASLDVPFADINTMMFPTADPMQYPNQAMTTFEDNHLQDFGYKGSPTMGPVAYPVSSVDIKPNPSAYSPSHLSNVLAARRPDNEVQLLGPMPMFLMQGAQQRGFQTPQGIHPANLQGQDPGPNMSFDELFTGDEWAQTFMDQGLGLSGNNAGFSRNPSFGPGGPGMGSWQ